MLPLTHILKLLAVFSWSEKRCHAIYKVDHIWYIGLLLFDGQNSQRIIFCLSNVGCGLLSLAHANSQEKKTYDKFNITRVSKVLKLTVNCKFSLINILTIPSAYNFE